MKRQGKRRSTRLRNRAPDLQEQHHHANAQQDVADAGDAGDRRGHPGGKLRAQHLRNTADDEHDGGHVQADVIGRQRPLRLRAGEGKALFQQKQQEKEHHAQQEVVRVHHAEGCSGGKAVELGELAVKHAADHGEKSVQQGSVHVAFHFLFLLV